MVKLLAIMKNRFSNTDFISSLQSNGFEVEIAFPTHFQDGEQGYGSYAALLCEMSVVKDLAVTSYLHKWNGPILYIVNQADLPITANHFRIGIEDYIVHPLNMPELLSRIQMLLRCAGVDAGRKIVRGSFCMDADARVATINETQIPLTMREFNILFGLLSSPDKTFTRKELLAEYWGDETTTRPRAVDVYMTKLRDKFSQCAEFQIVTVHGIGYKAVLKED